LTPGCSVNTVVVAKALISFFVAAFIEHSLSFGGGVRGAFS
jgi:hypothetical protein